MKMTKLSHATLMPVICTLILTQASCTSFRAAEKSSAGGASDEEAIPPVSVGGAFLQCDMPVATVESNHTFLAYSCVFRKDGGDMDMPTNITISYRILDKDKNQIMKKNQEIMREAKYLEFVLAQSDRAKYIEGEVSSPDLPEPYPFETELSEKMAPELSEINASGETVVVGQLQSGEDCDAPSNDGINIDPDNRLDDLYSLTIPKGSYNLSIKFPGICSMDPESKLLLYGEALSNVSQINIHPDQNLTLDNNQPIAIKGFDIDSQNKKTTVEVTLNVKGGELRITAEKNDGDAGFSFRRPDIEIMKK